jgi:alkylation response protein AidB-like acyl-CoA dehydrogenase
MPVTSDEVRQLVDRLLEEGATSDATAFLGLQFDLGLVRVDLPVGHGGLDADPALQEVVDEALAAAGRRYRWTRNPMGIGMCAPTIAVWGTEEQKARYLRPIYTAEEIWCQLFSEPGAGSDVAGLATRAVRDGDQWVVNGQKVWTSAAHVSSWGLLLARTDPDAPKHRGLTAFIVDMHGPGVDVRPLRQMSGGSDFNEVYFTDVGVPDSQRLGPEGEGWRVAHTTLMNERVSIGGAIAPRGSGAAVDAWRASRSRQAAHRASLLRLWVEAEVLRLGNLRAQALREKGTPGPEGSVLKLGSALLMQRITSLTVDLHGPAGMLVDGYDAPRAHAPGEGGGDPGLALLGAQSSTIAGGTSEIMRNILGERVLGLPREPGLDPSTPWSQIPRS